MLCKACGKPISRDELGLSKKLLGRATTDGYCIDCLSRKLNVDEARLREKIEEFRRAGCTLFV